MRAAFSYQRLNRESVRTNSQFQIENGSVDVRLFGYSRRGSAGPGSRTGLSGAITGLSGGSWIGGGGSSPGGIGIGGSSSLRIVSRSPRLSGSFTVVLSIAITAGCESAPGFRRELLLLLARSVGPAFCGCRVFRLGFSEAVGLESFRRWGEISDSADERWRAEASARGDPRRVALRPRPPTALCTWSAFSRRTIWQKLLRSPSAVCS